jgi:hypothetical protein
MRAVHGAMPTKDFHNAFAGTSSNPEKAIEVLTQAISAYSPASHYLAADPKLGDRTPIRRVAASHVRHWKYRR